MTPKTRSLPVPGAVMVTDPAMKNMLTYIDAGQYTKAIAWIQNKKLEEEQVIARSDVFDAYPADGAHAFTMVLRETYGWIEQKTIVSFFDSKPPRMLVVETGPDERTEVPWGQVAVPNIDGTMTLGSRNDNGVWKFVLSAEVKKKHIPAVRALCDRTREYLRDHSIYRGQPVRLEWKTSTPTMFTAAENGFDTPRFMAPTGMTKADLILPSVTWREINATIFSLIEKSGRARAMGVPTKRLVLAAGSFGTGKTLTAAITAELCRAYNRTFIYLRDVHHLADAIYFAQQYAPACVFAEDIDMVTDPKDVDQISNTIDGVDTKNLDVLFILTTNHVNRIPKKFLRSGRSDMIIRYTPPDREAAARLILKYGESTLDPAFTTANALTVGSRLAAAQMIPASIREVVERAKLFALAEDRQTITPTDLEDASHGVLEQCAMLSETRPARLPGHMEELGTLIRIKTNGIEQNIPIT